MFFFSPRGLVNVLGVADLTLFSIALSLVTRAFHSAGNAVSIYRQDLSVCIYMPFFLLIRFMIRGFNTLVISHRF